MKRSGAARLLLAAGLALTQAGGLVAALAGLGHRSGWWDFSTGFVVLRWGIYASIAGLAASVAALVGAALLKRPRLAVATLPAIAIGLAILSVPLNQLRLARNVPPIHDISTDLEDPPDFVALREEREAAPNGVDYPGEETARQQRDAYRDVAPLQLAAEPSTVFAQAEAVARDLGWRIVEADPADGRIEAVDRTLWFGFRDDVVIRITEAEDGRTQVDVRSASRVGQSDLGVNARRIEDFLSRLQERL
jgi:uncharacterized protein (DUF1499 family)